MTGVGVETRALVTWCLGRGNRLWEDWREKVVMLW